VDKLCARVICLDYAPAVFDADTEEVPEWDPVFNEPTALARKAPPIPQIKSGDLDDFQIIRKSDGTYLIRVGINYVIPSSSLLPAEWVQVEFRAIDSEAWQILPPIPAQTGIFYLTVEEPVQYEVKIRSISRLGATSDWSQTYIFDPAHQKVMDEESYLLVDASDNEIIIKDKPAPPVIEGLIAMPGFRSVIFSWDASTNLYHKDYIYRLKVSSAAWSAWLSTVNTQITRVLTQAEIDTYGVDAIVFIEVKDRNAFGQTSLLAASTDGQAERIRQVDLTGAIFQIVPSDSEENEVSDLKSLYDGVKASGGLAYDSADWVQYEYPVEFVIVGTMLWASASLDCYVSYSEDGATWNYLKAQADHTLSAGSLLAASDEADAQTNYWTTGAASGQLARAKWPYMRQAKYVRLHILSSATLFELKNWVYVVADEIIAGILHLADGLTIASADDDENAVILDQNGLRAFHDAAQHINIGNDGSVWFGENPATGTKFFQFDGTDVKVGRDTRLLGADAYNNNNIFFHTQFATIDDISTSASGGTLTNLGGAIALICSVSGNWIYGGINKNYTLKTPSWAKNRRFKTVVFYNGLVTTSIFYVGTGCVGPGDPVTTNHIGFRVLNGAVYGSVGNISGQTTVDLNVSLSGSTIYTLEAVFTAGTKTEFYIDGVYKGQITTGLPTGTVDAPLLFGTYLFNQTSPSSERSVRMSEFFMLQEE
jgi:hypothetical protein